MKNQITMPTYRLPGSLNRISRSNIVR